jgi:hypothetical protein
MVSALVPAARPAAAWDEFFAKKLTVNSNVGGSDEIEIFKDDLHFEHRAALDRGLYVGLKHTILS